MLENSSPSLLQLVYGIASIGSSRSTQSVFGYSCRLLSGRIVVFSGSRAELLAVQHSVVDCGEHHVCAHDTGEEL